MKIQFKFNGIIQLEGDFEGVPQELLEKVVPATGVISLDNQEYQQVEILEEETSDFNPYFKFLENLSIEGAKITSSHPVFSKEDLGKEFCGLFAHKNPDTPDKDSYFPGIVGSRYSKIIKVVSPKEIVTDFEYNTGSTFGYVFQDNSKVFYEKLKLGGRIDFPEGVLVIKDLVKTDLNKDTYLVGHAKGSSLMFGVEDYFRYTTDPQQKFDTVLFDLGDRSLNFASYNVNFLPPCRIVKCTESYFPRLFTNTRKSNQKLRVAIINCDTTLNQRNPMCNSFGFGLGFIYDSDNVFYLKNFKNRGGSFTDFKVPDGGKLWLVLENVQLDFENKKDFQTTYFLSKIRFTKDSKGLPQHPSYPEYVAETTDSSFYFFNNQFYARGWNNRLNMIHIDRFVFLLPSAQYFKNIHDPIFGGCENWRISDLLTQTMTGSKVMIFNIPEKGKKYWVQKSNNDTIRTFVNWSEIQGKTVHEVNVPENGQLVELQPGDIFEISGEDYKVLMKERGEYPTMPSGYQEFNRGEESQYIFANCKLDKSLPEGEIFEILIKKSCSEYLLDGKERPAYFMYKGNSQIALTEDTQFGNDQVLYTAGIGHLSYNHKEIGFWAKDTVHNGFYRQSSGKGQSPGYTMINSEGFGGEFHPDVPVKNSGELPEVVQEYMAELENMDIFPNKI
ncbi:hypothetical protein [Algoriphagus zhangzhouensis]|uniref:Uncharacterized protein n=1 Tax=Algoriphagus zhangzhouensis TaxID=1073327 RepID=A0A1M7ZHV6_9BACT|nr:hypothetical protein [Algoriphagus zhangzhouensis]TDY44277.1 hypothetical protein A8938_3490 [Algoriphagus zhangzhouensis]SHO64490.1 hypothetical protein SAMN04488108_3485 [Algoriphagus zhangzhouensis]